MSIKTNKMHSSGAMKSQQGVVLLVALVLLLVITIIGVSALGLSKDKTQVAGNSMYTMLVFQGAESALARTIRGEAQLNLKKAAEAGGNLTLSDTDTDPNNHVSVAAEKINNSANMQSTVNITQLNSAACAIVSGNANSVGAGFECKVFRVSAQTSLALTGARTRHTEGREVTLPKP